MRKIVLAIFTFIAMSVAFVRCDSKLPVDPPKVIDTTGSHPIDTTIIVIPDTTAVRDSLDSILNLNDTRFSASLRFKDKNVFAVQNIKEVRGIYSKANDYVGKSVSLDFAFVAPANDTLAKRPFILMVHEGAFLFGSLDNEMGKANSLAQKGFAAASINYRIGFNGASEGNSCGGTRQEVIMAIYRSMQDTYTALGYFLDRSEEFGIDKSQIFLAGSSAGGIAISSAMYMHEPDFEAMVPGIAKLLGKLDPGNIAGKSKVRALLTSLGYGVLHTGYITKDNSLPTIFFQRSGDNVLAYQQGELFFCPVYPFTYGAKATSDRLKILDKPFELNYEPLVGHTLSYPEEYVVTRYALFINRLWKKDLRQIINEKYKVVSDVAIK